MASDDVDFAESGAIATGNNCVPTATQLAAGEVFPVFAE